MSLFDRNSLFLWLCCTASLSRVWTQTTAVKVPSPNHWTTREFPHFNSWSRFSWDMAFWLTGSPFPQDFKDVIPLPSGWFGRWQLWVPHHYRIRPQAPGRSSLQPQSLSPLFTLQSLQTVAFTFCSEFTVSVGGSVGLLAYSARPGMELKNSCFKSLFCTASLKQSLKWNIE